MCYRLQLPLKPAWAVTIHKSQGMSLDAAAVQVRQSFLTTPYPPHHLPPHIPPLSTRTIPYPPLSTTPSTPLPTTPQTTGCFDAGMAYVAISRVRSLGGLRFRRLCPDSLSCAGCAK